MRAARAATWIALCALVVLGARAIAYALVPSPEARALAGKAAGPGLPVIAGGALLAALAVAALTVWLAWLAIRERHFLSGEAAPPPQLDPRRIALSAVGLWLAAMAGFTALETSLHANAGLGVHGLSCLGGPVHRNAVPILAALALLGAAVHAAARHVVAWARRTIHLFFRVRRPVFGRPQPSFAPLRILHAVPPARPVGARAPPPPVAV